MRFKMKHRTQFGLLPNSLVALLPRYFIIMFSSLSIIFSVLSRIYASAVFAAFSVASFLLVRNHSKNPEVDSSAMEMIDN
ncbi:MAG: hypothetical protein QXK65_02335, partial [Candidatus Micrarchaeaceae archaeon]